MSGPTPRKKTTRPMRPKVVEAAPDQAQEATVVEAVPEEMTLDQAKAAIHRLQGRIQNMRVQLGLQGETIADLQYDNAMLSDIAQQQNQILQQAQG